MVARNSRRGKTRAKVEPQRSVVQFQSVKSSDEKVGNGVDDILRNVGDAGFRAFVLMTIDGKDTVKIFTSDHIKPIVHGLLSKWGQEHLPMAQRAAEDLMPIVEEGQTRMTIGSMHPLERMTSRVIEETSPSSDRCQPDHERAMIKDEQSNNSGSRKHNVKAALVQPPNRRQTRQRTVPSHAPEPDPTPPSTQMCSFRLCEYEKVESYLRDRLLLMQQQALKRIAKAWIKGICPKKQAKFPYQNKHRREEENLLPKVPAWWPIDQCQYVEPDHIEKKERMALCMHLLRLRPTVEQLRSWNHELNEPYQMLEECGWTAFLRRLTPPSTLEGLGPKYESADKLEKRQKALNDLYDIAEKEEQYIRGEYDPEYTIHYEEDKDLKALQDKTPTGSKRSRDASIASDGQGSIGSKSSERRKSVKIKHEKQQKCSNRKEDLSARMCGINLTTNGGGSCSDADSQLHPGSFADVPSFPQGQTFAPRTAQLTMTQKARFEAQHAWDNFLKREHPAGGLHIPHPLGFAPGADMTYPASNSTSTSHTGSPLMTSFSSVNSGTDDMWDPYGFSDAPKGMPEKHYYGPQYPENGNNMIEVRHVVGIPQPEFGDTVPNTPLLSPMAGLQFVDSKPGRDFTEDHFGATAIPASMPAASYPIHSGDISVVQTVPQVNGVGYASGLSESEGQRRYEAPFSVSLPEYYGSRSVECPEGQAHGLPMVPCYGHPNPLENGPSVPFTYPEQKPDPNFPAAALPGSVHRGFTGNGSGVGGGSWT